MAPLLDFLNNLGDASPPLWEVIFWRAVTILFFRGPNKLIVLFLRIAPPP